MRILYDHDFFTMFGYSGITRYFYEIMTRLARMPGNRISPFMGFHKNRYGLENQRRLFDHFFGVAQPQIPRTGRIFKILNRAGLSLFAKIARPEIYHQTYYHYMLPGFKGKRIVTVHDMIYEIFPEIFDSGDPVLKEKRISVERADGIIAVSESTKRDLVRLWGIPEEKVRVIYHGNSLLAAPDGKVPVEGPYLLYVGQRIAHKNFAMLLNVFGRNAWIHEGYKLVCFGGGPFTEEEKALARSHGVEGRIQQLGGEDSVLASLYGKATALVYPSLYEGFGLPIVEAMSLGCPVILSRSSSLLEVGKDGGAFFDPKDPEELLAQLERVLQSPEVREEMRANGLRNAARFTWEQTAADTAAFYREVLGR